MASPELTTAISQPSALQAPLAETSPFETPFFAAPTESQGRTFLIWPSHVDGVSGGSRQLPPFGNADAMIGLHDSRWTRMGGPMTILGSDVAHVIAIGFGETTSADTLCGREYSARLEALRVHAWTDGAPFDAASEQDFLEFVSAQGPETKKASLTLLDDGTLRATWRNDDWRVGLRFCGDRTIDFVLLDRTNPPTGKAGTVSLKLFDIEHDSWDLNKSPLRG